ncbi:hypothetical protein BDN67DRAFT_1014979 [Paxillus ammoniavirescens]|nr:hypothetical protein BDN67DRAFT_1014979 [Paxillus ammoniavirescens]
MPFKGRRHLVMFGPSALCHATLLLRAAIFETPPLHLPPRHGSQAFRARAPLALCVGPPDDHPRTEHPAREEPPGPTPEPYASFWLEELRVARRAVTLMAMQDLPHSLPGPLRALSLQFIAAEMDGQAGRIAIMKGMKADDCEDLIEDKRSGLPWQDAWWQPGAPPLASDYASRPMNFHAVFRLGQIPVLCLKMMKSKVAAAYDAHCQAFFNRELHLNHSLDRVSQLCNTFGFKELLWTSMDGWFHGEDQSG